MTGSAILLHVLAAVALLLWATRLVRTAVERLLGERLRRVVGTATRSTAASFGTGLVAATALQSSTAASVLIASFARRGLVTAAAGLAFMLGADIGSTLIVQAFAFDLSQAVPVLLLVGVALFMAPLPTALTNTGRLLIGLALMIVALGMIVAASQPLRESPLVAAALARLTDDLTLAVLLGLALTWLLHSTVAMVLFIMSLAGTGIVSMPVAAALVLGANLGGGLVPLGMAWALGGVARQIMMGNFLARLVMVALGAVVVPAVLPWLGSVSGSPARALANLHLALNVGQALVTLPFVGIIAALVGRIMPQRPADQEMPAHLDAALLDKPTIALGNATREVMRLADSVEMMLRDVLEALSETDASRHAAIRRLDDDVDRRQEAIKLYLTRLSRGSLSEAEARRCFDLIMFTTHLEHVGDIIDKGLLPLAAKRARGGLTFSAEGWAEIAQLHQRTVAHLRLAMTVFQTGDRDLARQLVQEKDRFRDAEAHAVKAHLERLRSGMAATVETSTLHLDILRDLKRIVSHLTSVAHPILEAAGELRATRLEGTPKSAEA